MRKAALDTIADLVAVDERVVFVGSDLGAGTMAEIREQHPERVLMEGIAEQHLVGFSAGLALEGYVPYIHTIGTFLTRRALEQVIVDVALHDLPVRLIAAGGGMTYAPLGPTHQAIDDFALMRAIPNMVVLAPADPLEIRQAIELLSDYPGPAYVRLGKGGEPIVTQSLPPLAIGRAREMVEGNGVALLTTGGLLHECLGAVDLLDSDGFAVGLTHFPTVAPMDEAAIDALIDRYDVLVTVEEHLPTGGLGTAVAEIVAGSSQQVVFSRMSLPGHYATKYGSQSDHWHSAGLDAAGIASRVRSLVPGSVDAAITGVE